MDRLIYISKINRAMYRKPKEDFAESFLKTVIGNIGIFSGISFLLEVAFRRESNVIYFLLV